MKYWGICMSLKMLNYGLFCKPLVQVISSTVSYTLKLIFNVCIFYFINQFFMKWVDIKT